MADIRINSLPTTASASSSDDFLALDGATNGTRKLNAYSPTFGGNLTVSGTGTVTGDVTITRANSGGGVGVRNVNTDSSGYASLSLNNSGGTAQSFDIGTGGSAVAITALRQKLYIYDNTAGTTVMRLSGGSTSAVEFLGTGTHSFAGNLTVSGTGSSSFNSSRTDGTILSVNATDSVPATSGSTQNGGFRISGGTGNKYVLDTGVSNTNGYAWMQVSNNNNLEGAFAKPLVLNPNGGNLLIGTTTDGGQKLQVNGSVIIGSTSFEEFGTNGTAQFYAASGGTAALTLTSAGYYDWRIRGGSTSMTIVRDNTDMLSFDSSSNATFAGAITSSRPYQDISSGLSNIYVYSTDTAAQDKGGTIQLGGAYTGTTTTTFGGVRGSKESTTAGETGGQLEFFTRPNGGAMTRRAYIGSTGNATFAGTVTPTGGIVGVTTNSNAAAGIVGEIITSTVESGSAVSLSNTVISDVTSISLTAGDWDVDGNVGYSTSGATVTQFLQGIATASGTAGPTGSYSKNPMSLSSDSNSWFQDAPTWRVSISSTTTIYLIARSYFSAGTVAAYGFIRARRVR